MRKDKNRLLYIPIITLSISILLLLSISLFASNLNSKHYTALQTLGGVGVIASTFSIMMLSLNKGANNNKVESIDSLEMTSPEKNTLTFTSVAGNSEAKDSLQDIIEFLKTPEKFTKYGAKMPKGIILYGEPGTGKTLLAKAVAGEASVPFYALSGSDFVQVYVGVGASRIRTLFKKAKSHGKAVIFIDEIDAIGKARDNSKGGSDEKDQTLNALLTEMSGFNDSDGIIVLAATNRLDILDDALLRPGRFDRHIEVMLPDISARKQILSLYFKNKPISDNLCIDTIAEKTAFFSGAKLECLVNEAAIIAAKTNSPYITNEIIDKAFSIVIAGYEKQDRTSINQKDREITAYHESGHALASILLLPEDKVSKVTILPTTKGAGGYTLNIPQDSLYQDMSYLKNKIKVFLAGRAAEEVIFGKDFITTGAYNDLQKSTDLVTNMITKYGMSETFGLLTLNNMSTSQCINVPSVFEECSKTINTLYDEVKQLLIDNNELLSKLSNTLLDKETLNSNEIYSLVS